MDVTEAKEFLAANNIDNVRVVVTDFAGIARGKSVPVKKFLKGCEHGMALTLSLYAITVSTDGIASLPGVGVGSGFPDGSLWPDLNTLTVLPWDEGTAWAICDFRAQDGSELPYDPRTVLKRQIAHLDQLGIKAITGLEYEFYMLRETQQSLRQKRWSATELETLFLDGGCYQQDRLGKAGPLLKEISRQLEGAGVAVDMFHIEWGGGHLEFPLKEAEALVEADRAVLYKVGIREICHKHGLMPTFMAKIGPSFEGVSGAVHHSLVDSQGNNLFYDPHRPFGLSEIFDHWCEGLLQHLPDMTLMLLPNYNSYKRPLPGSFVANTTTWGVENRDTAMRAINMDPQATRIESRIPAADANPYLVLAAHLAAGNYGLRHKLRLRPPFSGSDPAVDDQGREDVLRIPTSLEAAVTRFRDSEQMREMFGNAFCEMFAAHRQSDVDYFARTVSELERERYLEYV